MSSKKEAPAEGGEEPPKKKGKLLIFVIAGVVLLLVLVGVAVMMMKKNADSVEGEDGEEVVQQEKPKKKEKKKEEGGHATPPAYHKFDKPFVAKLVSDQGDAYIQVDIQLKLLDPQTAELVKGADPEIRHRITLLLMSKKIMELSGAPAVQKLSNEIRVAINHILHPPPPSKKKKKGGKPDVHEEPEEIPDEADPEDPIQAVLFTQFIIQ